MASSGLSLLGKAALVGRLESALDDEDAQMEKAVAELHQEIQNRAPVDTGRLRDSYHVEIEDRGGTAVGRVQTDVPYAVFQEYGTSKMRAQPHVRPAIEAKRGQIIDHFGKTISFE